MQNVAKKSETPVSKAELSTIEKLCFASIEAAIRRLREIGTWPRPPAARRLRVGYDFGQDDLQNIQEVDNLVQYLASDENIKSIYFGGYSTSGLRILHDFWEQLLLNILSETEGISLNERVFRKWFNKFIKELYTVTAVWRTVDTITGLTLRGARLKFDHATVLTSIPAWSLRRITWGQEQHIKENWGATGFDKATIITTVRIPKCQYAGSPLPYPYLLKNTERSLAVMNAIRLNKSGVPRLHCHARVHLSYFPLCDPLAYCERESNLGLYQKETIVDRSDFHNIRKLWRELMDTRYKDFPYTPDKLNAMDVALGRFSASYAHRYWLDNIVDLTIALESLLGPEDNQEISHRISLRAAWLLGVDERGAEDSGKMKNKIYDRVRAMYKIRSYRVHGSKTTKENKMREREWIRTLSGVEYDESKRGEQLEAAVESARDIVRKAIMACAKLQKLGADGPHWPFKKKEDFDANIVINGQRKIWQKAAGIKDRR